jgi:type I restriction enzyme R subunit
VAGLDALQAQVDKLKELQVETEAKLDPLMPSVLDRELPESYGRELIKSISGRIYDLVFDYSSKGLKWAA